MVRQLAALPEQDFLPELDRRHQALVSQGHDPLVASAYQRVAPLLWENNALQTFSARHPMYRQAFPQVLDRSEAVALATKDHRLDASQQRDLSNLLATMPQ
jgi:hypothetical protein